MFLKIKKKAIAQTKVLSIRFLLSEDRLSLKKGKFN